MKYAIALPMILCASFANASTLQPLMCEGEVGFTVDEKLENGTASILSDDKKNVVVLPMKLMGKENGKSKFMVFVPMVSYVAEISEPIQAGNQDDVTTRIYKVTATSRMDNKTETKNYTCLSFNFKN